MSVTECKAPSEPLPGQHGDFRHRPVNPNVGGVTSGGAHCPQETNVLRRELIVNKDCTDELARQLLQTQATKPRAWKCFIGRSINSHHEGAIITGLEKVDVVDTDVTILEGAIKGVEKTGRVPVELERIGTLLEDVDNALGVVSEALGLTVGCGVAVVFSFIGVDVGIDAGVDSIDGCIEEPFDTVSRINAKGAIITGLEKVDVVDTDVTILEGAIKGVKKTGRVPVELERIGTLLEDVDDALGVVSEALGLTVGCGVAVFFSFIGVDVGIDAGVDSIDGCIEEPFDNGVDGADLCFEGAFDDGVEDALLPNGSLRFRVDSFTGCFDSQRLDFLGFSPGSRHFLKPDRGVVGSEEEAIEYKSVISRKYEYISTDELSNVYRNDVTSVVTSQYYHDSWPETAYNAEEEHVDKCSLETKYPFSMDFLPLVYIYVILCAGTDEEVIIDNEPIDVPEDDVQREVYAQIIIFSTLPSFLESQFNSENTDDTTYTTEITAEVNIEDGDVKEANYGLRNSIKPSGSTRSGREMIAEKFGSEHKQQSKMGKEFKGIKLKSKSMGGNDVTVDTFDQQKKGLKFRVNIPTPDNWKNVQVAVNNPQFNDGQADKGSGMFGSSTNLKNGANELTIPVFIGRLKPLADGRTFESRRFDDNDDDSDENGPDERTAEDEGGSDIEDAVTLRSEVKRKLIIALVCVSVAFIAIILFMMCFVCCNQCIAKRRMEAAVCYSERHSPPRYFILPGKGLDHCHPCISKNPEYCEELPPCKDDESEDEEPVCSDHEDEPYGHRRHRSPGHHHHHHSKSPHKKRKHSHSPRRKKKGKKKKVCPCVQ
ncbi:uncharacterized protein [Ambystoma mexicanum]|uniref:uncharacterized protein n=1 Tax=Ambystoma mexicanum TaxID=8296 RepID=UPI0037E9C5CB